MKSVESSREDPGDLQFICLTVPCGKKGFKKSVDKLIIHIGIWKTTARNVAKRSVNI